MRTLTTKATVRDDHILVAPVPEDIPPGQRNVMIVLEDEAIDPKPIRPLEIKPHQTGPADSSCTWRQEDLYGDTGR